MNLLLIEDDVQLAAEIAAPLSAQGFDVTRITDGAAGLETLLAAALRLHHSGEVALPTLLRPLTVNPAKLFGLPGGRLKAGAPADIILVDLDEPWVVNKDLLRSRSKNSPFDEAKMQGRVLRTIVAGETVHEFSAADRR